MEILRLTTERSYLASVGIQSHQVWLYADDPLPWTETDALWDLLDLDGATATPTIEVSRTAEIRENVKRAKRAKEILESAKQAKPAPVLSLQTEASLSGPSGHNVVHILSRVRER
jgi:hypothetical protein